MVIHAPSSDALILSAVVLKQSVDLDLDILLIQKACTKEYMPEVSR